MGWSDFEKIERKVVISTKSLMLFGRFCFLLCKTIYFSLAKHILVSSEFDQHCVSSVCF